MSSLPEKAADEAANRAAHKATNRAADGFAAIGRFSERYLTRGSEIMREVGGVSLLTLRGLAHAFLGPFVGPRRLWLRQLFPLMRNVGARSFPIVSLVAFLMGAILVLQTGEPLKRLGQIQEVPGAVALALAREIAPLMTAILMTARVGASFTAVLGSMKINEELLALQTMGISLNAYLISPRFTSMLVMVPCLTVFAYLMGMTGGALVAAAVYDLPYELYINKTVYYLTMTDLTSGLVKSALFAILTTGICCHFGIETKGGSVGLGRNIMVAVVTSIIAIIMMDAVATGWINNYIL